jgi:hypothetical protein
VELAILKSRKLRDDNPVYNPQIMASLAEAQEWDKLGRWMGAVWTIWPPGAGRTTEEDLEYLMILLFKSSHSGWGSQARNGARKCLNFPNGSLNRHGK